MMEAFHTFRVRHPETFICLEDFELFILALSALEWRKHNGKIRLITDSCGAEYFDKCGLSQVWDAIDVRLDEMNVQGINENVFWAGSKLYALSRHSAPCVMIDMDFILWKHIDFSTFGEDLAVIHREDIYSPVYPSKEYFHFNGDWQLPDWLNWSVRPCNGALVYFGSQKFIQVYTDFALEFMKRTDERDDRLCYMVFVEQRWMAMCAEYLDIPIKELSSMDRLFDSKQSYFTHIWGYKQKLKDNQQAANKFCKKCAQRLSHDFPEKANKLADYSWASKYFGIQ